MLLALILALTGTIISTPAPQDAAPSATSRPADGSAEQFLESSRIRLYDIERAGLESMAFSLPVTTPHPTTGESMRLGDVAVRWAAGSEPQISASVANDLPEAMASMTEMLEAQLIGQGQQVLGYVRNDLFLGLLEGYDATLGGTEDGLVHVHFEPKQRDQTGQPPIDGYFRDHVPVRLKISIEAMNVEMSFDHTWRPVSETDSTLVLQELTVTQDLGFAKMEARTTFDYSWSGGLLVLSGYVEEITPPDAPMASNDVRLESVQVNGSPLGAASGSGSGADSADG